MSGWMTGDADWVETTEQKEAAVDSKWTPVCEALAELYQEYYEMGKPVEQNRVDVETALARLMSAYNVWLG